jgi:mgtE-like transporter
MYHWKRIVRYGLPLLSLCVMIEIFVGNMLQNNQELLLQQLPIFLISIPVINSVGGNIGSILGAHLASGLHIGTIQLNPKDKHMNENVFSAIVMGIITYCVLAIGIYFIASFTPITMNISLSGFFIIFIATGFFLICSLSIISVLTAFISFRQGIDPDDVVAPIVTTVGDTLGIIFLFFFIGVGML